MGVGGAVVIKPTRRTALPTPRHQPSDTIQAGRRAVLVWQDPLWAANERLVFVFTAMKQFRNNRGVHSLPSAVLVGLLEVSEVP